MSPFIEEYDKRYQDYLAKQIEFFDEEYDTLAMKYHHGRIDTAQHNFYFVRLTKYFSTNAQ